ncbi:MAG: peptidylprolyl isomerase [Polyangiales bacterium]
MFDKLKGFGLVFLVVLLSLVFIVQFGGSQSEGCGASNTTYVAKVYHRTINQGEVESIYELAGFSRMQEQELIDRGITTMVIDGLIERELLAHEGRTIGLDVSEDEVAKRFANDGAVLLTLQSRMNEIVIPMKDDDGNFDKEAAKRFIQYRLRRSVGEFFDQQRSEVVAERVRKLVRSNVSISDAEAWQAFQDENDNAKIEYARFPVRQFMGAEPSDADVSAWISAHGDELDKAYEENKYKYTNLEEQVRARHILIKVAPDASEDDRNAAKSKAEDLRKRALAGADFAKLAEEFSDDTGSAKRGGDLGFNVRGRMVKPFDDAQFALETVKISEVISTQFGFHVIQLVDRRKGDVPAEVAKREIATEKVKSAASEEEAKRAAAAFLSRWKNATDETAFKGALVVESDKNPSAPKLLETDAFGWGDTPIPGLPANPLISSAMAMDQGAFVDVPMKAGGDFIVFKMTERNKPAREKFDDAAKQETIAELRTRRENEALQLFVSELRDKARADKSIRIAQPYAAPSDESRSDG